MKQLTIFCSRDLEDRVVSALDRAKVDAFLRVGEATGNRFRSAGQVPRLMTWEAVLFLVPMISEEGLGAIVDELEAYAGACEIEPCLRIVVSPVDRVH